MDEIQRYKIIYTETATCDMEEKADYISLQLQEPILAERWYLNLRADIQQNLSFLPFKYPAYPVEPWASRGIRMFSTSNDVILYSVDDTVKTVYIRGVCTKGRDMTAHLEEQDSLK